MSAKDRLKSKGKQEMTYEKADILTLKKMVIEEIKNELQLKGTSQVGLKNPFAL
jgi:hypothetical protein